MISKDFREMPISSSYISGYTIINAKKRTMTRKENILIKILLAKFMKSVCFLKVYTGPHTGTVTLSSNDCVFVTNKR